jgi:hypothetical protein
MVPAMTREFLKKVTETSNYPVRNNLPSVYIQCYPQADDFSPLLLAFIRIFLAEGMPY